MERMRSRHGNGFRQRAEDNYEVEEYDNDEYDEEASGHEEEDEVEDIKPTKEEQDFLKLRERLKSEIRQKMKKEGGTTFGNLSSSQDNTKTAAKQKFGSFFGPSQPVIAPRVIEESRSIRETKHIIAKVSSSYSDKKDPSSSTIKTHKHHQQPKVINEVKKKAQTLKDMRDYSFLLSDDADLPSPAKEQPASRSSSTPKSDGRSAQAPLKSKIQTSKPAYLASNGHNLKNSSITNRQQHSSKVGPVKEALVNKQRPISIESRKVPIGTGGVKSSQIAANKDLTHKPTTKVPVKPVVANKPTTKVASAKPPSMQSHYVEQKRVARGPDKVKAVAKQSLPTTKAQLSKKISSRGIYEDRSRSKPVRRNFDDEDGDGDYAIGMIRKMFGYDPSRFAGRDEDDSDMEVGFDVIQKEERRSSKIGRKEDEEQLRLIEEEERRERMRKKQKLR